MEKREATVTRKTKETQITLTINLDGSGICSASTGIGFFDHMLEGFARHGLFDLHVTCQGDLHVDCHHTIEDVGIVLGEAVKKALGQKEGIRRYGNMMLPMDESLVICAIDLSGRPFLCFDSEYATERIGDMDTEMIREFFYAVSYSAGMNLHIKKLYGSNSHHIAEATFKAFARALAEAVEKEPRMEGVWSTKGIL